MAADIGSSDISEGLWYFLMRVRRRLARMAHRRRIRRRDAQGAVESWVNGTRMLMQESIEAAWPGASASSDVPTDASSSMLSALDEIRAHRFDLLGSGPKQLIAVEDANAAARRDRFLALTDELPQSVVAEYTPIEWHSDFISGHRWDPREHYLDVRVAPVAGADIKLPRELSRFQHVGVLASSIGTGSLHEAACLEIALEMCDWISANPLRRGVNWASAMDVAIRAVNWVWALSLSRDWYSDFPITRARILAALCDHAKHVEENLEYAKERNGNHYLANLAGLLYVGAVVPSSLDADRWLHIALQELVAEMDRQVYDDGANFEASTSYHRLVLELFLSCAILTERLPLRRRERLAERAGEAIPLGPVLRSLRDSGIGVAAWSSMLPPRFYDRLTRMAEFTAALTKANGCMPQFGDNDSGRLHKLSFANDEDVLDHRHVLAATAALVGRSDLADVGEDASDEAQLLVGDVLPVSPIVRGMPRPSARIFSNTGIAVARRGDVYVAVTCGPNGNAGHGGHGHNDKGSFEFALGEQDYVVDGGSFVYSSDPAMRNRFRSTAAHNTIWVDAREQDPIPSGVDGLFSLPQRAKRSLELVDEPIPRIIATHDGFGAPHRRTFSISPEQLLIEDVVEFADACFIGFNLSPNVKASVVSSGADRIVRLVVRGRGDVTLHVNGVTDIRVGDGFYSHGYGRRVANQRVVARLTGGRAISRFVWST